MNTEGVRATIDISATDRGLQQELNKIIQLNKNIQSLALTMSKVAVNQEKLNTQTAKTSVEEAKIATQLAKEQAQLEKNALAKEQGALKTQKLNLQIKKLSSSVNKSTKSFSLSSFGLLKFSTNLQNIIGFARQTAQAMTELLQNSTDYIETQNLFEVSMGKTTLQATKFINEMSEAFNLDDAPLKQAMGTFNLLGKQMGLTTEQALIWSETLTKLSADTSSLRNTDFETAFTKLKAGIVGEAEPLREWGIDITEATLKQEALANGIKKSYYEMTYGEKAILRYSAILSQTTSDQQDFARTLDSPAQLLRQLNQQFTALARSIGNLVLPILNKLLVPLLAVTMVLKELAEWLFVILGLELPLTDSSTIVDNATDMADALEGSVKSAKELKKWLGGYDELNNVVPSTTSSSSGSSGTGLGIDSEFLKLIETYDNKMSSVNNKASEIRDKIMEWLGFTKLVNEETSEITWRYDRANQTLTDIAKQLSETLAEKLNSITDDVEWNEIGSKIATGLNVALTFANTFVDTYEWSELGGGFASSINNMIDNLDAEELGKSLTNKFKIMIESANGFLEEFDWVEFGQFIGETISGALNNVDLSGIAKSVSSLFEGLFSAGWNAIINFDWKGFLKNLAEGFESLNTPLKILSELAVAQTILNISDSLQSLYKNLSNDSYVSSLKNLVDLISKNGLGDITSGLNLSSWDVWQATLTEGEKFKNLIYGATGIVAGLTMVNDAFKQMGTDGVTAFEAIQVAIGGITTLISGYLTGGTTGLILSAIGLIADAIISLLQLAGQEVDEGMSKAEEYQQKINELYKTASENVYASESSINRISDLVVELGYLYDANGKIKESEKERADIILTRLNNELGTEYRLTENLTIKNGELEVSYEDVKKELQELIKTKRLNAILDAYSDIYQENLKKEAELIRKKQRAEEKLQIAQEMGREASAEEYELLIDRYDEELKAIDKDIYAYENMFAVIEAGYDETSEVYQEAMDKVADSSFDVMGIQIENANKATEVFGEETNKQKTFFEGVIDSVAGVSKATIELTKEPKTVEIKANTSLFDKAIGLVKSQKISIDTILNLKSNTSSIKSFAQSLVDNVYSAFPTTVKKWLHIDGYATGGMPEIGSLFYAGEGNSAELVGNIGGRTNVINEAQLENALYRAVIKANREQGSNTTPITNEIYIGGNKTDTILEKRSNRRKNITGVA